MEITSLLAVARGDEPADLLLKNGRIVNVFSGEIEQADIAIAGDRIAGLGSGYVARETIDLRGAHVAPGLIDAHVHIESSLCTPPQFATAVVPRGVTTVIADPHEIANVAGAAGVRFMHESSRGLPLRVVLMAPSCVPATDLATSGAALNATDLESLLREGIVHGLAEVMNYPGAIRGEPQVLAKLRAFEHRPRDGHAPGVLGNSLNAYIAAGIGSDHECVTVDEAKERLARGMYVLVRDATNARNLAALLPMITPANSRRICFCTDDRQPAHLLSEGSVDSMLREAIRFGIDPIDALRMCTLNACEWFGLHDRGAIAPGRLADIFTFADLKSPAAELVISGGKQVSEHPAAPLPATPALRAGIKLDIDRVDFRIPARGRRVRAIVSLPDQLITHERIVEATIEKEHAVADPQRDLLKLAVIERHRGTGNVGLGFIQGFGLKRGAIAGTVAHDHHNLVVIGCDDDSMRAAAAATDGAGLAAADGTNVLARLPLPVAGLMSDQPIHRVREAYEQLLAAAGSLGSTLTDPFMAMSFMALEVIPKLKLTDRGLVDVEHFRLVDLFAV